MNGWKFGKEIEKIKEMSRVEDYPCALALRCYFVFENKTGR